MALKIRGKVAVALLPDQSNVVGSVIMMFSDLKEIGRMKDLHLVSALLLVALVSGCATTPQAPITFSTMKDEVESINIGVVMTPIPEVNTYEVGADCLLCLAVVAAANAKLTEHIVTLSQEDIPQLKVMLGDLLSEKGYNVTVIDEDLILKDFKKFKSSTPNTSKYNFSSFKESHNLDQLMVIDISVLGTYRTYSGYIPTSDPQAAFIGTGYIVNLEDHTYEWYLPVDVQRSGGAEWKEPPSYPGLTNAYYQVIEEGKDAMLHPFMN